MVDLSAKPFFLSAAQIAWVEDTLAGMTLDEKVGQLFVQMAESRDEQDIARVLGQFHQGGLRYEGGNARAVWEQNRLYQKHSKIPLLIACNCDNGGDGAMKDGTYISTAAGAAAGRDPQTAYDMGYVTGREAGAIGCNWTFNPCADIFLNWRNTIVNTRCFGETPDDVLANISAYIKGVHESNMACCCKHFPGDGVEERDQHLVLGVNDLSPEDWEKSYGRVYRTMIDAGLESIMVGHFAFPALTRRLRPGIAERDIMPATLSPELIGGYLRGEMGFNGLVITDASHMAGIANMKPRREAVPEAIAAGCDMFLFSNVMEEDFGYMKRGVESGLISSGRLEDALRRILGLKARLGLPELRAKNALTPPLEGLAVVGCEDHLARARRAADRVITLVKDTDHNLPIRPEKQKRACLYYISSTPVSRAYKGDPVRQVVVEELERAGFSVQAAPNFHDLEAQYGPRAENEKIMRDCGSVEEFKKKYDVVFLVINVRGYAQENNVRIRWSCNHSNELPWYAVEVPTVGISLNYTTHLWDVPQLRTFINAYGSTRCAIRSAIEKATGKSEFHGVPGESVFCGKWETRL